MRFKTCVLLVTCFAFAANLAADEKRPTVDDFAWLAGCWDGSGGGREALEQWMKPSGRTMLGMSRTVAGGKTVAYEFIRLHEQDGGIVYTAAPSGQKETSFKLVKHADQEAVFENLEHDFPQRVIYKLEKDGALAAAIEGTRQGKLKRIDFPLRRVRCD